MLQFFIAAFIAACILFYFTCAAGLTENMLVVVSCDLDLGPMTPHSQT